MEEIRNAYAKGIGINEVKDRPRHLAIMQEDNIKVEK
jgi:hypothetical protein